MIPSANRRARRRAAATEVERQPAAAMATLAATILLACASGPPRPAPLDQATEPCASCRMIISDAHVAAQVVAPGEEPRFFDDLQCLRDGLRAGGRLPPGATIFVVDFPTGAWVPGATARFARRPEIATPMASHWVAYAGDPAAGIASIDAATFLADAAGGSDR